MRTIQDYISLLAGEHRGKPKFEATVSLLTAPLVSLQRFLEGLPQQFDLDEAVGVQLDIDGLWIGRSRQIEVPLPDVFFSFDIPGLGFDQGVWFGPFTPSEGLTSFDDETYRQLLRAKIVANQWNGTITQMQQALQTILNPYPSTIFGIIDNYDMTMDIGISGQYPPRLIFYMITGNYVPFKPEGVRLNIYVTSYETAPLFGLDVETSFISGLDIGAWGVDPSQIQSLPVVVPSNNSFATIQGSGSLIVRGNLPQFAMINISAQGTIIGAPHTPAAGTATLRGSAVVVAQASGANASAVIPGAVSVKVSAIIPGHQQVGQAALAGTGNVTAATTTAAHTQQGTSRIAGTGAASVTILESSEGTQVIRQT